DLNIALNTAQVHPCAAPDEPSQLVQHGAAEEAVLGRFRRSPLQCFRLLQSSLIITRAVGRLHRLERIQGSNSARDLAMPAMTPIPDQVVEKERNRDSNKKNGQHGSNVLRRT